MKLNALGLGIAGKSPNVNAQQRLNLYLDVTPDMDKSNVTAYPTPGLEIWGDVVSGDTIRGFWYFESINLLFYVRSNKLYQITDSGVSTLRGTLNVADLTGYVSMADNGTQLIIVTGTRGYIYTPGTTVFAEIVDADWPGGNTVCFLDSFFIVNKPSTGQFWISASYDGTSWDALDYATAESSPDYLIAVWPDRGALVLFGSYSVEIWYNTGGTFPYQRIIGAPVQHGLAARWSVARCAGMLHGLFKNRQGQLFIGRLNGYNVEKISPTNLDYQINGYSTPSDAVAYAYTMNGHTFYQLSFIAEGVTWLYDATSNAWSKLQSTGFTRHLADLGAAIGQLQVVSDYRNGAFYKLNGDVYTDNGTYVVRELVGPHVFDNISLNWIICNRLRLDVQGGVGLTLGQGINPKVMLEISRDGGHTWENEIDASIGKIGEYTYKAEWRRLGRAKDFLFKIRITDPVYFVLMGEYGEFKRCNA